MTNEIFYSVVVPLYNEELVIKESYTRIKEAISSVNENYEVIFVNDGSRDDTRDIVEKICEENKKIKLINFTRNFGQQAAITAGMELSSGDAIIVIDADLQDPPEAIPNMIEKWKEGYEVVYGKRRKREGETFFKKFTAKVFYRLLKNMTSIDIPVDTGDFRLIDRKVCDILISLPERNRYVRGLVSWVGYKQTFVEVSRQERFAGVTKYSLKKMIKLAFDGITSFSNKPLVMWEYFGVISFFMGVILFISDIVKDRVYHRAVLNYGLIISINFIMFGLVFLSIGIMGEYIARIYDESKDRPNYIIASTVNAKKLNKKVK